MNQVNAYGRMDSRQISGVFSPWGYGLGDRGDHLSRYRQLAQSVEFGEYDAARSYPRVSSTTTTRLAINIAAVGGKFKSAEITSAAIGNALNVTNK